MGSAPAFSTPGFYEIAVLAILALLIFGPDRLPGMARNAGRMLTQLRREASTTLDELKRAAEVEELRSTAEELRATGAQLRSSGSEITAALPSTAGSRRTGASPPAGPDAPPPFDPDAT